MGTGDYDDLWRACANLATGTRENALQSSERWICHQHAHNIHEPLAKLPGASCCAAAFTLWGRFVVAIEVSVPERLS